MFSYKNDNSLLKAVKQCKREATLGVAVLNFSELHMYKFYYDYIKPKYCNKATLLFAATDSLTYNVKTRDIYKDIKDNKKLFNRSGYETDGYRKQDNTN